jgi:hypothetical protein
MNSAEHSPSWAANSHSASQEILPLSLNPKVHCHVHNSTTLDPILIKIKILSSHFPWHFSTKILYAFLIFKYHDITRSY